MNGQRVDHYRGTLLGRHVAESFDQDKVDDGLVVGEAGVYGNIHVVRLHRYRRRHHTVERREHLVRLVRKYLSCLLVTRRLDPLLRNSGGILELGML